MQLQPTQNPTSFINSSLELIEINSRSHDIPGKDESALSGALHQRVSVDRLHLRHGPIDIIALVDAPEDLRSRAYASAIQRFKTLLEELVSELSLLRRSWSTNFPEVRGSVACRMVDAVTNSECFVTPMAAVAGAVADEILDTLLDVEGLDRVLVNNGGDIAFWLSSGTTCRIGVVNTPSITDLRPELEISSRSPVRGIATSGWRGRSQSLGIADAVTVLARNAAEADAAATLIANAVNVGHPGILRKPSSMLVDDSDLGELPVTVCVPILPVKLVVEALECGYRVANEFIKSGRIEAAYLSLQKLTRAVLKSESKEP